MVMGRGVVLGCLTGLDWTGLKNCAFMVDGDFFIGK